MKNTLLLFFTFLFAGSLYSQSIGFSYQAVILPKTQTLPGVPESRGPLINSQICFRFNILDSNDKLEYQETVTATTDEYGIVNLVVGSGTQVGGYARTFAGIIWSSEIKKLMVELDLSTSCATFEEISNQVLSTVPLSSNSLTANNVSGIVNIVNGGTGASSVAEALVNFGLNNVNNTSDLNKPISIASQVAFDLKEDKVNKSTNIVSDAASDIKYPSVKAIKTYIDDLKGSLQNIVITSPTTPPGKTGDIVYNTDPTNGLPVGPMYWNGTTWITISAATDATTSAKGVIKLAGDLGGNAGSPTVPGLLIRELLVNKSTDVSLDAASDIKYPSVKAIKTYVDALKGSLQNIVITSPTTPPGKSGDIVYNTDPTNGIPVGPMYWDGDEWITIGAATDATTSAKGVIKLAGDLGGTAGSPTVPGLLTRELLVNKSTDVSLDAASDIKYPSVKAIKTYVDALKGSLQNIVITSPTSPPGKTGDIVYNTDPTNGLPVGPMYWDGDEWITISAATEATTLSKGIIQLAGDLGGTAGSPTVLGLADKEEKVNRSIDVVSDAASDIKYPSVKAVKTYVDGSKGSLKSVALDSSSSPVGNATGEIVYNTNPTSGLPIGPVYWDGATWSTIGSATDATTLAKGIIQLTGDLGGTAGSPTVPGLGNKEENANKSIDVTLDAASDIKYPSVKAVKTYVDSSKGSLKSVALDSSSSPVGNATGEIVYNTNPTSGLPIGPVYWDGATWSTIGSATDATTLAKGIIQLAGDLGGLGSVATAPVIAADAITSGKILDATITDSDLSNGVGGIYKGDGALMKTGTTTVAQATNKLAFTATTVDAFNVANNTLSIDASNNIIGIGIATPNTDALLDLSSTTKGLLLPRVALTNTTQPAPLVAHVAGMTVYNTATTADVSPGTYSNNGVSWVKSTAATGATQVVQTALEAQTTFTTPSTITSIDKIEVYRNGIRVGVTLDTATTIKLDGSITCNVDDEIRIVQKE